MDLGRYGALCLPYLIVQSRRHHVSSFLRAGLKILPIIMLTNQTVKSPAKLTNYRTLIGAGLVLSMAGDLFMDADRFLEGLSAFLVAHIFYIVAFSSAPVPDRLPPWKSVATAMLVYSLSLSGAFFVSQHAESKFRVPLWMYAFTIATMANRAFLLYKHEPKTFYGSILFAFSDFVIAVNKFYTPVPGAHLLIMVTYYAGQYGIAASAASPFKLRKD